MPRETRLTPAWRNAAEPAGLDAGRVGFERHFEIAGRFEHADGIFDQQGGGLGRHQARCAAAEENRPQPAAAEPGGLPGQLGAQRLAEAILVDPVADMAVEIAIRAFGQAERPVNVEGEVVHRPLYRWIRHERGGSGSATRPHRSARASRPRG